MGFFHNAGCLRTLGRYIVLPTKEIKKICGLFFADKNIEIIVDLGSGTLFWTRWLYRFCEKIFAVDVVYEHFIPKLDYVKNIVYEVDAIKTISAMSSAKDACLFMSDVLHHLDEEFEKEVMSISYERFKYIIIKDINKNSKFSKMNKVHDLIFNGEHIREQDPFFHLSQLEKHGYKETVKNFV